MNVEPVICACGNPVSGGGEDIAWVLFGPMCDACIRIACHEAGRLCDRCIHRLNTQQEPFLVAHGPHQPAVTAWAERTAERYRISAVQVRNEGSPYHSVSVDFADTPMTWLG